MGTSEVVSTFLAETGSGLSFWIVFLGDAGGVSVFTDPATPVSEVFTIGFMGAGLDASVSSAEGAGGVFGAGDVRATVPGAPVIQPARVKKNTPAIPPMSIFLMVSE